MASVSQTVECLLFSVKLVPTGIKIIIYPQECTCCILYIHVHTCIYKRVHKYVHIH